MMGWIKNIIEMATIDAVQRDFKDQINMLGESDNDEVGLALATAHAFRIILSRDFGVPSGLFNIHEPRDDIKCDLFILKLRRMIRERRWAGAYADVAGLKILLNTALAIKITDLKYLGVIMWIELRRGSHYAKDYLPIILMSMDLDESEKYLDYVYMIPPGLEP